MVSRLLVSAHVYRLASLVNLCAPARKTSISQNPACVGPKVNRWTGVEIQAVLKGATTLDGEWKSVEGATAAEKAAMRFFKVVVEVP